MPCTNIFYSNNQIGYNKWFIHVKGNFYTKLIILKIQVCLLFSPASRKIISNILTYFGSKYYAEIIVVNNIEKVIIFRPV